MMVSEATVGVRTQAREMARKWLLKLKKSHVEVTMDLAREEVRRISEQYRDEQMRSAYIESFFAVVETEGNHDGEE